ncbi:MAG: ATP-grasp domain-containing protein [Planctomycetota bacterium]
MNVLFLSPSFPVEMPHFVKALAQVGANVIGMGEHPEGALPADVRHCLSAYVQTGSLADEARWVEDAKAVAKKVNVDRVECLWEPGVMLAARVREALELPGMGVEQARLFRDKELMKQALDKAGIRTPRHVRARTEDECRTAAEQIGYPLIIKPISGAGSADTHRVDRAEDLEGVLQQVAHVREVSVEEFITGQEYTYDTICANDRLLFANTSWYRPQPLVGRTLEWVSPQTICFRHPDQPMLRSGREMGKAVLTALGFETGFTHMEWFLTDAGEAVFGEIAARPPGALSVDIMNHAYDTSLFRAWAEAVTFGRFQHPVEPHYNAAVIFKRASGQGRIQSIQGLERLVARYRPYIVEVDLNPIGAPRRNWKQTLLSDGHVMLRHPDVHAILEMADRVGMDLQIQAG